MGADIIVELDRSGDMATRATKRSAGSGECVSGEKRVVLARGADGMDADDETGDGDTGVTEGDDGEFGSI